MKNNPMKSNKHLPEKIRGVRAWVMFNDKNEPIFLTRDKPIFADNLTLKMFKKNTKLCLITPIK